MLYTQKITLIFIVSHYPTSVGMQKFELNEVMNFLKVWLNELSFCHNIPIWSFYPKNSFQSSCSGLLIIVLVICLLSYSSLVRSAFNKENASIRFVYGKMCWVFSLLLVGIFRLSPLKVVPLLGSWSKNI